MPLSDEAKTYLVECFWPGVTEGQTETAARRARKAAQLADVEFLGSILVLGDETVFCLFEGDEASVVAVAAEAGIRFERVLESVRIDGT